MRDTIVVLTEEALGADDAARVASLHAGEDLAHRVLVPADTERNVLAELLDHLSLGELRAALDAVRGAPDPERARADARTALERSLAALREAGLAAEGATTEDDPLPALRAAVTDPAQPAREVIVVTRVHAVEDTFHRDWASRARDELGVPVLHLYAGTPRLG